MDAVFVQRLEINKTVENIHVEFNTVLYIYIKYTYIQIHIYIKYTHTYIYKIYKYISIYIYLYI